MTCGRAPIDLSPVRLALDQGDQAALVAFTREVCHLPSSDWPYVGQVLFQLATRIGQLENPAAYIRKVAGRLKEQAESSLFGSQVVLDEHRRIIGHASVGGYVTEDGTVAEEMLQGRLGENGAALGYVPIDVTRTNHAIPCDPQCRRADEWQGKWVPTEDPDERDLQRMQMQGVPRTQVAARLGWDEQRVNRVRLRLWRRRRAQCNRLSHGS